MRSLDRCSQKLLQRYELRTLIRLRSDPRKRGKNRDQVRNHLLHRNVWLLAEPKTKAMHRESMTTLHTAVKLDRRMMLIQVNQVVDAKIRVLSPPPGVVEAESLIKIKCSNSPRWPGIRGQHPITVLRILKLSYSYSHVIARGCRIRHPRCAAKQTSYPSFHRQTLRTQSFLKSWLTPILD